MVIEVHSDYLFPRTESTADEAQDAMAALSAMAIGPAM